MSRLEELIQQYCPDGVEYRPIWSLTAWDKKFNGIDKSKQKKVIKYNYLLAADLKSYQVEGGTVKLLTTNISNLYTTEELAEDLASDGEVVAIPWGGNPIVQYYKGRFLTADNRIATSLDTTLLNNKFLYYCMLSKMKVIASFYRGSGIKHPDMSKVLDLEIPVPPLPVQEEIVRILDTLTELQAELQAELQKRLQQYNYYRDNLLSFEGRTDIEWKKLGDVCNFMNGKGHEKSIVENGKYIVVNSKFISTQGCVRKYSDKQISPLFVGDVLMVMSDLPNGRALAKCFIVDKDNLYTLNQRICSLTVKNQNELLSKYLFYITNRNRQLLRFDNGVDQTNLKKDDILNILIPIISIAEQQRIVDILDRFDKLTNDITEGLPAEIEARRKQYEYYRDQLLTFKQKA